MSGNDIIKFFSDNGLSITSNVVEELLDLPQGMLSGNECNNIIELPVLL